jgi:hypothetical protein
MPVKQRTHTWSGVTFTIAPDTSRGGNHYIVILPGGKRLPAGTTINATKKTIDLPGGKHLSFDSGRIIQNTPNPKRDKLAKTTYTQTDYSTGKPIGAPAKPKKTPARSGDDRRPRVPVSKPAPAKPVAPKAPAKPAPSKAAPAAPTGGRGTSAPAAHAPHVPRAPHTPRAAPGGATAAPAAATPARAPAKVNPKDVDAEVRRMFGDVAAFLSDPELGPILRKAATEGWDTSRLFGALQQTKFWKTKGDDERKWTILNTLDNATARRQVEQQAQGIWDLTRQAGIELTGLQVHDLSVNALKFGWSVQETREQAFKLLDGKKGGLDTAVAQQYGYLAAFLDNPELGPLLERGAREGWTPQRLEAELQKTNFWQSTTDAQRRFNAMEEQTPGEAVQAVAARASEILTLAQSLGVQVDPSRLQEIAKDSLRFGWNSSQIRASVTAEFDYVGGESGLAGQSSRQIREMAAQYLVPVSDQMLEKWTEQIVAGTADLEGFNGYLVEQAKSLFPGMASALDKGVTVAQYADPYRQIAARELEMNPESIDLNDPRFRKMLDQVNSKGERVSMTLSESAEYLRKLPEWQQTRGANEKAASLTESILRTFGGIA